MLATMALLILAAVYLVWGVKPVALVEQHDVIGPQPGALRAAFGDLAPVTGDSDAANLIGLVDQVRALSPHVVGLLGLNDRNAADTLARQLGPGWRTAFLPPERPSARPAAIFVSPHVTLGDRYLLDLNDQMTAVAVTVAGQDQEPILLVLSRIRPNAERTTRLMAWLETHQTPTIVLAGAIEHDEPTPEIQRFRQQFAAVACAADAIPVYITPSSRAVRNVKSPHGRRAANLHVVDIAAR